LLLCRNIALKWSIHGLATVTLLPRLAGTFYSVSAGDNAGSAAQVFVANALSMILGSMN
jgi:hypothetical protein